MGDQSYVVALLWAWLMTNPDYYMSYVSPYTQLRYIGRDMSICAIKIGGHYRHKAEFRAIVPALSCVCRFERLVVPRGLGTPVSAHRQRWSEDGSIIPMRERQVVWS